MEGAIALSVTMLSRKKDLNKNKAPPPKSTGKKTNYNKNSDDVLAKLRCAKAIEKKLRRGPDDPTMRRCAPILSKSNQQTTKKQKQKKKLSPNG